MQRRAERPEGACAHACIVQRLHACIVQRCACFAAPQGGCARVSAQQRRAEHLNS
jgi:hypothetical protein